MKYVLMFAADASAMADVDPAVAQEVYGRVYQWFAENAAVITDSGAELLGAETATGDPEIDRIWFAPNVWPAEVAQLQGLVDEYTTAMRTLSASSAGG